MVIQKRLTGQPVTKPETKRLLTAAAYFLRERNFSDCRTYALRARDSDPTNPAPARILAITAALSAPPRDYYAVFGLPHFEPDARRIRSAFKTLSSNLNPNVNPYPVAAEARDLVVKAWSVLPNPSEKAAFDDALRRNLSASDAGGTFWTICPYCYHVYEYDAVYVDCCLKCSNKKCGRVLHAVPITAPPPEIVEKGRYFWEGFMPFEISGSNGEELVEKLWGLFRGDPKVTNYEERVMVDTLDKETTKTDCKRKVDVRVDNEEGIVVDTSDKERTELGCKWRKVEVRVHSEEGVVVDTLDKERTETDGKKRNVKVSVDSKMKDSNDVRMKSVPWDSRKVMGRGAIIDENQGGSVYGVGEEEAETGLETEFGGGVSSGVEFFEGDDDVFIGLQCLQDDDMGF